MNIRTRYIIAIVALLIGLPLAAYFAQAMPSIVHQGLTIGGLYARAVGSVLSFTAMQATVDGIDQVLESWTLGSLLFWSVVGGGLFACALHACFNDADDFWMSVVQRWTAAIKDNNSPEVIAKFRQDYRVYQKAKRGSDEERAAEVELDRIVPILIAEAEKVDSTFHFRRYQAAALLGCVLFSFGSFGTFILGWIMAFIIICWSVSTPREKREIPSTEDIASMRF